MAQTQSITVRPLQGRLELAEAAAVAARALHVDPFFSYLAPDAVQRDRGLALYWRGVLAGLTPRGHCLVAEFNGRIVGAAAWSPPGGYPYGLFQQAREAAAAFRALCRRPQVIAAAAQALLALDRAHPHGDHWYLQLLVADPSTQRSGVGAALLGEVLHTCDREGHWSYVETSNEANVAYYARHRYVLQATLSPIRGGPSIWTMRREPEPSIAGL